MSPIAEVKLSNMAQVITIQLEQAVPKDARRIVIDTSAALCRPITEIERDVSNALTELEGIVFVESFLPGCTSRHLACCVPALARAYRLTRRGHTWKCDRFRSRCGIKHPYDDR